jgi:phage baseplate assembly protein W
MAENKDFLGRGWSFPPRFVGKFSRLDMVEVEDEIRESLYIILSTIPGERVTNPEFGCNIYDLIWSPIDKATKILMDEVIRAAVTRYEPRVEIEAINIDSDDEAGTVYIHLDYTIRKVNVRTNIVYPFYKLEGTDIVEV